MGNKIQFFLCQKDDCLIKIRAINIPIKIVGEEIISFEENLNCSMYLKTVFNIITTNAQSKI